MAFCKNCGTSIGLFARKKVKHADGRVSLVCKGCLPSVLAGEQGHQPGQAGPSLDAATILDAPKPATMDPTIAPHVEALNKSVHDTDHLRALHAIYFDRREYDKAWCTARALVFLGKAEPETAAFYQQYASSTFDKARTPMTEETWARLRHPKQDRYVGALLASVWRAAGSVNAQPHKNYGLRSKDRRQLETDQLLVSKIFLYAAQVLQISPLPEVYTQSEHPGRLLLAACLDKRRLVPALVVRQELLAGTSETEAAFAIAEKLSLLRPEHYLALGAPSLHHNSVTAWAAISLVHPDYPAPGEFHEDIQRFCPELSKRLQPAERAQLERVVERFMQSRPPLDVAGWRNAVSATAHRTGLLISGDLDAAVSAIRATPVVQGGAPPSEAVEDLVRFSVSEDFFAVREHLGLALG